MSGRSKGLKSKDKKNKAKKGGGKSGGRKNNKNGTKGGQKSGNTVHDPDCLCCNGTTIEERKGLVLEHITENGFSVAAVSASRNTPAFCYTIGLKLSMDHPELIIIGNFPVKTVYSTIAQTVGMIRSGKNALECFADTERPYEKCDITADTIMAINSKFRFSEDERSQKSVIDSMLIKNPDATKTEPMGAPMGVIRVCRERKLELLCQAADLFGDDKFDAVQLIIPDANGKLPWDEGADKNWERDSGQIPLDQPRRTAAQILELFDKMKAGSTVFLSEPVKEENVE